MSIENMGIERLRSLLSEKSADLASANRAIMELRAENESLAERVRFAGVSSAAKEKRVIAIAQVAGCIFGTVTGCSPHYAVSEARHIWNEVLRQTETDAI